MVVKKSSREGVPAKPAGKLRCVALGVYREKRFSPGRHAAGDAEILELTQAALEQQGCQTCLVEPERLTACPPGTRVVFAMCQGPEPLAVLEQWQRQGVMVLNTPAAIRACYRLSLIATLSQAEVAFPRSVIVTLDETAETDKVWPLLSGAVEGCWVKRGDVHAMQADDVSFVRHATAWRAQVASFRRRGIGHAVVQEHIDGQEIKFYALRSHGVLHYVSPHDHGTPHIDRERLEVLVRQAGEVLDLDIYGGDCILKPDGELVLVDINDWPSFRGCRPQAARYIARHLLTRARQHGLL